MSTDFVYQADREHEKEMDKEAAKIERLLYRLSLVKYRVMLAWAIGFFVGGITTKLMFG